MSLYEEFLKTREKSEAAYRELLQEKGRFTIGPSSTDGLYIKSHSKVIGDTGIIQISHINEEEAKFIIESLTRIYGL